MRAGSGGPRGTAPYRADDDGATGFRGGNRATRQYTADPIGATGLGTQARDVDISVSSFRNLLVGGGITGFGTVLCAAALATQGSGVWLWVWQLLFGMAFCWFLAASPGALSSRGVLFDHTGLYVRDRGDVVGVGWDEIHGVGVGTLPWIKQGRLANPQRKQAFELYPSDPMFPTRHPHLERWRVHEPPPMHGLPGVRYRFHLPPLSGLPRRLQRAVQSVAPRKWIGRYHREPLPPT